MKKLSFLFLFVLIFSACKKGENDPFLSLKSRDARIQGTWVLKESSHTEQNSNNISSSSYSETYNGSLITVAETGYPTYSVSYTSEIKIEKGGNYMNTTVINGDTYTTEGSWWWLTDNKKKTRLSMDDDYNSYEIDRLTNKELVLKYDISEKESNADGTFSTSTVTVSKTYEKK